MKLHFIFLPDNVHITVVKMIEPVKIYGIIVCLLFCSSILLPQSTSIPIIINTKYVNPGEFSISGPGVLSTYISGQGNTGERFTINPSIPSSGIGTIQISILETTYNVPLDILLDFDELGVIHNVRVQKDGEELSLSPSLYEITSNEIIFRQQGAQKPISTIELSTNLINGVLFDRSEMAFFEIYGLERFSQHQIRIYKIGENNTDYAVFSEYVISSSEEDISELVFSSSTELRWNGCESDPNDPTNSELFKNLPSGTYSFEVDVWDDESHKTTLRGQMLVRGINLN